MSSKSTLCLLSNGVCRVVEEMTTRKIQLADRAGRLQTFIIEHPATVSSSP